ncbi:MAG TPA: aminoglycoside phosphotransferase family protein [Verrucomicrobiae bacterium]
MNTRVQDAVRPLYKGGTSDVFIHGEGRVLKLLHRRFPRSTAELELEITRALHAAGLPVPAAYEVVEQDGRCGIVFERVGGGSLLQLVEQKPWRIFWSARLLAELHARVHRHTAPAELPTQREQLETWLRKALDFTPTERRAAEESLALVPSGNSVCHGDMHPANILLTSRGPVIIDWTSGRRGNPVVDVARTCVLFESAKLPPDARWHMHMLLALARQLLHRAYLSRYFRLTGLRADEVVKFLPIQRAATSAWRCRKPD